MSVDHTAYDLNVGIDADGGDINRDLEIHYGPLTKTLQDR